uniref:Uncharacterized protein n=1 Tax=Vibrio cholerae O37 TaxID=185332 RepID=H9CJE1_VIBCL|nr:hypothetical protein [Vibrio cholerae O37]
MEDKRTRKAWNISLLYRSSDHNSVDDLSLYIQYRYEFYKDLSIPVQVSI